MEGCVCVAWRVEKVIYLSLHCRHHNDSCIKIGTDESHFTVSLILRDKVRRRCPQATTFLKSSKGGPKRKPVCRAVYVYTRQLKPRVRTERSQCVMLSTYIPDSRSIESAQKEASVLFCLHVYQIVEAESPHRKKRVCHAVCVYTRQSKQRVRTERSQCVMLSTCIPDSRSSESVQKEASVSCCLRVYQTVEAASPHRKKPVYHAVYMYTRQSKPRVVQKPVCHAVYVYTRQSKQRVVQKEASVSAVRDRVAASEGQTVRTRWFSACRSPTSVPSQSPPVRV